MSAPRHWFEDLADHLGSAYLRYSFTKGTAQEVDFLVGALGLGRGRRVLDVGCGPGRHARALAERGIEVHGIDISQRFVELARHEAPTGATFERLDARALPFEAEFDAVISLCQGAFGLQGRGGPGEPVDVDATVLRGMARALRPGGVVAVTGFNAYFSVRYQTDADFDAERGVAHERTSIKDEQGRDAEVEMWTTCFTPRELRLLARSVGLEPEAVWGVEPGRYGAEPPTVDHPELLLLARRPEASAPGGVEMVQRAEAD